MSLGAADKFKPLNGQTYKLMDAVDIDYDGQGTSLKAKVDEALAGGGGGSNVQAATNEQIDAALNTLGQ